MNNCPTMMCLVKKKKKKACVNIVNNQHLQFHIITFHLFTIDPKHFEERSSGRIREYTLKKYSVKTRIIKS